jgi:hypothetical protein
MRWPRIATLLVALFSIAIGVVGIVSPERVTMARRHYFASPATLYPAIAIRIFMGLVVMLAARGSRAPKVMRTLGAVMCLQAVSATVLGPENARAVMEWEAAQGTAVLRLGAVAALAAGSFMAIAVTGARRRRPE